MDESVEYQKVIDKLFQQISSQENLGKVADYIPELSKVDPNLFGICLRTIDDKIYGAGDWQTRFSIQSISKVLSLSLAYRELEDTIWDRVGVEPSGSPFNSLVQLETDNGIPRNPFINAGAMVICDMLISHKRNAADYF